MSKKYIGDWGDKMSRKKWTANLDGDNTRVATFDIETDPFAKDRIPKPFCCGFYDTGNNTYTDFWGDDCIEQFIVWLADQPDSRRYLIYAHNGGRFDYFYMHQYFETIKMIGSRIALASFKQHELRDSYSALPVSLSQFEKTKIDYAKFERHVRNKHKKEILEYLKSDCINLANFIGAFRDKFGDALTMASAAMAQLTRFHEWSRLSPPEDKMFRRFYFGGRVECFESGEIKGPLKVYDVNSEYPFVMANFEHPIDNKWELGSRIGKNTCFAEIEAWNYGAIPTRKETGGLDFTVRQGRFYATIHEIQAGLETGTLKIDKVLRTFDFRNRIRFNEFIETFYKARLEAREKGDDTNTLFYKLVMNSAYGKFAQNPANFRDWTITEGDNPGDEWELETIYEGRFFFSKPTSIIAGRSSYFNVATGASITGAARAYLLRGLAKSTRPIYCDTDSIICEGLEADKDSKRLGAWKLEGEGDTLYVAGKKMYALFKDGEKVKTASKGVRLSAESIKRVSMGEFVEHASDVPSFELSGKHGFITRRVRKTAEKPHTFGRGKTTSKSNQLNLRSKVILGLTV